MSAATFTSGENTKEFAVKLDERSTGLAELTERMGSSGVNILTLSMGLNSEDELVRLITSDETTCREILNQLKCSFIEREIVTVTLEDRPGAFARLLKKLKRAKVRLTSAYMINRNAGKVEFVLGMDDIEKGRKLLFDRLKLQE